MGFVLTWVDASGELRSTAPASTLADIPGGLRAIPVARLESSNMAPERPQGEAQPLQAQSTGLSLTDLDPGNHASAFTAFSELADTKRTELRVGLQAYLDAVHRHLNSEGRPGHFGTLEANVAFVRALNALLERSGLRVRSRSGPGALLQCARPKRARHAGYFSFKFTDPAGGGTKTEKGLPEPGASQRLPPLQLVLAEPHRSRRK